MVLSEPVARNSMYYCTILVILRGRFGGIPLNSTFISPYSTHFRSFPWKSPKIEEFTVLGRQTPILGARGWKYHTFGTVIACPNAMAAKEPTITPETPKIPYFSGIHQNLVKLAKICFWCFGVQNGARRGHRVWTSYYCAKLVAFPPFTSRNRHFPPQPPKNYNFRWF